MTQRVLLMLGAIVMLGCGDDDAASGPRIWVCDCQMSTVHSHADICSESDPAEQAIVSCSCTKTDQSCTPEANAPDAGIDSPFAND